MPIEGRQRDIGSYYIRNRGGLPGILEKKTSREHETASPLKTLRNCPKRPRDESNPSTPLFSSPSGNQIIKDREGNVPPAAASIEKRGRNGISIPVVTGGFAKVTVWGSRKRRSPHLSNSVWEDVHHSLKRKRGPLGKRGFKRTPRRSNSGRPPWRTGKNLRPPLKKTRAQRPRVSRNPSNREGFPRGRGVRNTSSRKKIQQTTKVCWWGYSDARPCTGMWKQNTRFGGERRKRPPED